jgi:hypothetical protein
MLVMDALRQQRGWIVAVLMVLLLAAAFSIGRAGTAEGQAEGDDLLNEGTVCFNTGEQVASYAIGGPAGYNITRFTLGFATLQGFGGPHVLVRNVNLSVAGDLVEVVLTEPARRPVCAAWHLIEQEFFG